MSYWAVARLEPRREQLALRCLGLAGHETYFRGCVSIGSYTDAGSKSGRRSFRVIVPHRRQWYAARWSLGVIGLIMDGVRPARVADQVIDDLRKRERNGLIELPQRSGLKPGDQVRILQGSFAGSSDSMLACELTRCWHASSRAGAGVAGVARRTAACRARKECRKGD